MPPTALLLLGGGGRCLGLGLVGGRCRILGGRICGRLLLGLVGKEPALVHGPAVRRLAGDERHDAHPKGGGASASGRSSASGGAEHGSVEATCGDDGSMAMAREEFLVAL